MKTTKHEGAKRRALVMLAAASDGVVERVGVGAERQSGVRSPKLLTPQEQKEGWMLLFDGKTLDKWNVTPELAKVWKVVDGAIKADLTGDGGTMLTKDTFDNFALKVEFRAHPDINSGIMLRNPPPRPATPPGKNRHLASGGPGYELQIRDRNPGNYSSGDFLTGSVVNVGKAPHDQRSFRISGTRLTSPSTRITLSCSSTAGRSSTPTIRSARPGHRPATGAPGRSSATRTSNSGI